MSAGAIYTKTALGAAEIVDRKLRLPPRLRTMLILIDGHQPEFLIKEEAEKVGAPADFIDQLMARGLIEKSGQIAAAANSPDVGPPLRWPRHRKQTNTHVFARRRIS